MSNPLQREFDRVRKSKPRHDLRKRAKVRRKVMRKRAEQWHAKHSTPLALPHQNDYDRRLDSTFSLSYMSVLIIIGVLAAILLIEGWYGFAHGIGFF